MKAVPGSYGWRLTSGDGQVVLPVYPFGSLATFPNGCERWHAIPIGMACHEFSQPAQKVKAHGFASPSFDGYALSGMKGVAIQARQKRLAPKPPPNLTA